jgi:hypothetical protein
MRESRHRAAAISSSRNVKTHDAPAPESGDAAGRLKLNGEVIRPRD